MPSKAFHDGPRRCPHSVQSLTHSPSLPSLVTREADITHRRTAVADDPSIGRSVLPYAYVRRPIHSLSPLSASSSLALSGRRRDRPTPFSTRGWNVDQRPPPLNQEEGRRPLRRPGSRRIVKALTKTQKHAASAPHSASPSLRLTLSISMRTRQEARSLANSSEEMESLGRMRTTRRVAADRKGSCFFVALFTSGCYFCSSGSEDDLG